VGLFLIEGVFMSSPVERAFPLSVHRAFVVQLHAESNMEGGQVMGRVEHVVSGQAAMFQSLDALLTFMARMVRQTSHEAVA
jgi:hypothetical protein